jgi:hypothetical protein
MIGSSANVWADDRETRGLPDHEWIVADMRTLSLARRFDGILAWDSYFHLSYDDQKQMFDEARTVWLTQSRASV